MSKAKDHLTITIDPETREMLAELVRQSTLSVSAHIRQMIRRAAKKNRAAQKKSVDTGM